MNHMGFVVNRFKRMTPAEVVFRINQKLQNVFEESKYRYHDFDDVVIDWECKLFSKEIQLHNQENIFIKADKLLNNQLDIFCLKDYFLGGKIDYHTDYKSGKSAPCDVFGKAINYRDSGRIGDIKYIWEVNRHLFLLPLALAFKLSGKKEYLEKFEYYLLEWITQNPFMLGVNWSSSLELGIRLINWTFSWHLLSQAIQDGLKEKWLKSIYRHCWFISRNLSRYSSANNHLIGEAAGLFIAASALPKFKDSRKWQDKAYKILVREAEKQNYKDGVNKEQAISYQQFVLDFLLIAGLVGKANQSNFPESYWFMLERMLVYLGAIEDIGGNFPQFGDEDDGFVLDLMQREYGVYRSLLNTGAYLFQRETFLTDQGGIDDKTLILLNMAGNSPYLKPGIKAQYPKRFDEGGYFILGKDFGFPTEQKLVFDCGPLGYLSLAAHGHADALSFVFSAGGNPIFIDPGTFAYHADKKWRSYFRSTAAHNTVRLDGKDQSVMAGNFMWSKKAKAKLILYEESHRVKGTHDGYKRLKRAASHIREVILDPDNGGWKVTDEVISQGTHTVELFYHIHPDCSVDVRENTVNIFFKKGICTLTFEKDLGISIHEGDEVNLLGWYSPSYDVKVPCKTIKLHKKTSGPCKIETLFKVKFER